MLPLLLVNLLVIAAPAGLSVWYSFTDWSGIGEWNFVGLSNYVNLFKDDRVLAAYGFSFLFAIVATILTNVISLAIALGLNAKIKARNFWRGVYFVPYVLAILVIGYVFQFFNLVPTLTAYENVQVVIELTGRGDRSRVMDLLAVVGLPDRADHFPVQLSGGEQQRVSIARALATDPDLVLADEPAGALDVATGHRVLELLQQTSRAGRGVIMVTHNEATAEIADHVARMRDGAIVSTDRNDAPADAATIQW